MAPSTAGPGMIGERGEIERDVGAAELEQLLERGPGGAAQRVGLDLVFLAEADDERALVAIAQENGAAKRAVEFRRGHAGGQGTALDEKGDEIGRADGGSANVEFEGGHDGA